MAEQTNHDGPRHFPLCVDVDGTLLRTDLLLESVLGLIKQDPLAVFRLPYWALQGKAQLKSKIAERVDLDVGSLPFNQNVLAYVRNEHRKGRPIILASASHTKFIDALAGHLECVDSSMATTAGLNLRGADKAMKLCEKYGEKGFEYIGNSTVDFPVWERAGYVSVVATNERFTRSVRDRFAIEKVFETSEFSWVAIAKAMRLHQWLKNILIFIPILLAHRFLDLRSLTYSVLAFLSFSLVASGVYVLNDLLDLESDRRHPRKKSRPWAAGDLSIKFAPLLLLLFVAGTSIGVYVSASFLVVLGIYFISTCLYSFRLKQVPLVDILVLALLYTTRIIAGGEATGIVVSQWLLGVSMFLFLSLACVKRFSELLNLRARNQTISHGRGYHIDDMEQIAMFGSSAGYMAALVLALYVSSEDVEVLYHQPKVIWLACPLLLYWISRVWLLARRGLVHEDPLVFALRDRATYIVAAMTAAVFLLAM